MSKPKNENVDKYCDVAMNEWPLHLRLFNQFCFIVVLAFSKLMWRWSLDGKPAFEPDPEKPVGTVYVANHASMLDPALLVAYAGRKKRFLRPLYKSELDASGFLAWFFSRVGAIPIHRGTADMKCVKRAVAALKRGENILIFPQGTRVWDPHERSEIFGGFSLMAQMAGADVVPIALDGTERINPYKRHKLPRPSRVRVRFGERIRLSDVPGTTRKEKVAALEKMAMDAVFSMRDDIRRENGLD